MRDDHDIKHDTEDFMASASFGIRDGFLNGKPFRTPYLRVETHIMHVSLQSLVIDLAREDADKLRTLADDLDTYFAQHDEYHDWQAHIAAKGNPEDAPSRA